MCVCLYTHTHTHTDTHFSPLLGVDCRILVPWLRIKLTLAVKVQSPSASLDNQGIFSLCIFLIFCWIIHSLTELSTSPPPRAEGLEHRLLIRSVAQSCLTLCDPPGSSLHGISQTRIPEWAACSSFSRGSSWSRDQILASCIAGGFPTTEPPWKHSLNKACSH